VSLRETVFSLYFQIGHFRVSLRENVLHFTHWLIPPSTHKKPFIFFIKIVKILSFTPFWVTMSRETKLDILECRWGEAFLKTNGHNRQYGHNGRFFKTEFPESRWAGLILLICFFPITPISPMVPPAKLEIPESRWAGRFSILLFVFIVFLSLYYMISTSSLWRSRCTLSLPNWFPPISDWSRKRGISTLELPHFRTSPHIYSILVNHFICKTFKANILNDAKIRNVFNREWTLTRF